MAQLEIFHETTPHYACSTISGAGVGSYEAMQEALRLERLTGVTGWMIRDHRSSPARVYPAFITPLVRA